MKIKTTKAHRTYGSRAHKGREEVSGPAVFPLCAFRAFVVKNSLGFLTVSNFEE
jgi:hypothetical protein